MFTYKKIRVSVFFFPNNSKKKKILCEEKIDRAGLLFGCLFSHVRTCRVVLEYKQNETIDSPDICAIIVPVCLAFQASCYCRSQLGTTDDYFSPLAACMAPSFTIRLAGKNEAS